MASNEFNLLSYLGRLLFAAVLVFCTYNPTDYSFVDWVFSEESTFGPVMALAGVALLIGWIIFLTATFQSLGWLGIILFGLLFACVVWLFIDLGWLSLESTSATTWVVMILLALVLGTGMSWSHIWRRMTGQVDVDDVED